MFPGLLLTVRQSGQCGVKVSRITHGRDMDISTVRLYGNYWYESYYFMVCVFSKRRTSFRFVYVSIHFSQGFICNLNQQILTCESFRVSAFTAMNGKHVWLLLEFSQDSPIYNKCFFDIQLITVYELKKSVFIITFAFK